MYEPSSAAAIASRSNSRLSPSTRATSSEEVAVSKASNRASLSSCRSLLYVSGRPLSVTSSETRSPTARPDLPRRISAGSGFFFCGMMLEPLAARSWSRAKPNSLDVQSTTSSAQRDRWTMASAQANSASAT